MTMVRQVALLIITAFVIFAAPAGAATPPPNCQVWYDGCNTCTKVGGTLRCTARACVRKGEAACRKWAVPKGCVAWNDGCNSCIRSVRGRTICTQRACTKLKPFRCYRRVVMPARCQLYFDGCNTCRRALGRVTCTVRTCPARRPARCMVATGRRPANCVRWFDGCNVCKRTSAGWACTRRACGPNQRRPVRCLQTR